MSKRKNLTISKEVLPACREYLWDEERSRATVEKYLRDVRVSLKYVEENRALGKERVREYREELRERYKISSANSMLVAVSNFLVFLGREELKVRLFRVQKVLYSRPEREMTEEDYERLVRAARRYGNLNMSAPLQTIGNTGIRISELRFITVGPLEAGRVETYDKGKSRVMLLPVELDRVLKKYCRETGILTGNIFITKHGNPMDRSNVSKRMRQLVRGAGAGENGVFLRNFRHLFAKISHSVERGVMKLMDLLGRASISTTGIHTMTTEDQSRRQMSRIRMVLG